MGVGWSINTQILVIMVSKAVNKKLHKKVDPQNSQRVKEIKQTILSNKK